MKNGYIAIYNGKKAEIYAGSLWEAKKEAVDVNGPFGGVPLTKWNSVAIMLAEKDGKPVVHDPAIL
jgi:hypothetical protein